MNTYITIYQYISSTCQPNLLLQMSLLSFYGSISSHTIHSSHVLSFSLSKSYSPIFQFMLSIVELSNLSNLIHLFKLSTLISDSLKCHSNSTSLYFYWNYSRRSLRYLNHYRMYYPQWYQLYFPFHLYKHYSNEITALIV